jgi:hypothetical protein
MTEEAKKDEKAAQFNEIYRKIGDLETHVINLIHPIQCLSKLIGPDRILQNFITQFSSPLKIDDRQIIKSIEEFVAALDIYSDKMNLKALIDTFMSINSITWKVEEIQKRMDGIEGRLDALYVKIDNLCKEGIKVSFSVAEKYPPKSEELITIDKKTGKRRRFKLAPQRA